MCVCGNELARTSYRTYLGTICPRYELSGVQFVLVPVVLGTSCLWYKLSWVRAILGLSCLGYELPRSLSWVLFYKFSLTKHAIFFQLYSEIRFIRVWALYWGGNTRHLWKIKWVSLHAIFIRYFMFEISSRNEKENLSVCIYSLSYDSIARSDHVLSL